MKIGACLSLFLIAGLTGVPSTFADEPGKPADQPPKSVEASPKPPSEPEKPAPVAAPAVSPWTSISYPALTPWRKCITMPGLRIENKGKDGMELTLRYYLPSEHEQKRTGKVKAETITAELYRERAMPARLTGTSDSHIYYGSGPQSEYRELETTHAFTIPWGPNALDEAWVRLGFKDRVYWVELPYGFTRDPAAPPAPADPRRGDPKELPFVKKRYAPLDLVIPWEYVSYPLNDFKGGGSVTVNVSNSFDAMTELELWNFGGDVREPRCAVTNVLKPGYEKDGQCISLILEKSSDPFRSQMFRYSRGSADGRCWCQVRVAIGGEERVLTVPSSLVSYVHGHVTLPEGVPQLRIAEKWWSRL